MSYRIASPWMRWRRRISTAANELLRRLGEAKRSTLADGIFRRAGDEFMPLPW